MGRPRHLLARHLAAATMVPTTRTLAVSRRSELLHRPTRQVPCRSVVELARYCLLFHPNPYMHGCCRALHGAWVCRRWGPS